MTPLPLGALARTVLTATLLAVSGCASLRSGRHDTAPPTASPPVEAADAPSTAPPPDSGSDSGSDSRPAGGDTAANTPACTCVEAKPTKPVVTRPKPRPKPVHKEAPPQLPTAPVVSEVPPGGVVNAQVRAMSVSVMSILGKRVAGPNGEDLGRVVDVLADASGRVRVAIIDFGGFLGVGNHRIAVDWPLLRFSPDGRDPSLLLSLSKEKLQAAPEYKDNPRPQALMEPPGPEGAPAAIAPGTPASAPATVPATAPETKQ